VTVDILKNPTIREAVKLYSQWPTYPQLYLQGQFVGGCDIMGELFDKGDLHPLVAQAQAQAQAQA
jgi:monothiol glutaredoxin